MTPRPLSRSVASLALAFIVAATIMVFVHQPPAVQARLQADVVVNPGDSIQAAIDSANPGDRILINAGIYTESLTLNRAVSLEGQSSATTIIRAVSGQRVLTVTGATITPSTAISGLTFTGGSIDSGTACNGTNCGGGILISDTAQPLIQNVTLANNAALVGGGLYATAGSPLTLINVNVLDNSAPSASRGSGAGIYAESSLTVIGGLFANNTSGRSGGAVYVDGALYLTGTQFISNSAKDGGGLFHAGSSDGRVVNALFARNSASGMGAAILVETLGNVQVLHTTIADPAGASNKAMDVTTGTVSVTNTIVSGHSFGIRQLGGGAVYEDYNLFFDNGNDLSGGIITGGHSLVGDPSFVDPASGNYHLSAGSAAINAGVDAGVRNDHDGDRRPLGGGFDIGMDEAQQASVVVDPALGGTLTYTSSQGSAIRIDVPPGAVSVTTQVYYSLLPTATLPAPPSNLRFSGAPFELDAFPDGSALPGLVFLTPVTITINYASADLAGIDETTLALYRLEPVVGWQSIGFRPGETQTLNLNDRILTANVLSFSRWGRMGNIPGGENPEHKVFLPTVIR
jgi:predicted outer membrane repeat protein